MPIDRKRIRGRLEIVSINGIRGNMAQGLCQDSLVYVSNARLYLGKTCLARFDLKGDRDLNFPPRGNFITSQIPPNFVGLPSERYILCALWSETMQHRGPVPSLHEIEMHYDPGKKGYCCFLRKDSDDSQGRYMVSSREISEREGSIVYLIKEVLPKSTEFARLIVAEGTEQLTRVVEEIASMGISPIVMEPRPEFSHRLSVPQR